MLVPKGFDFDYDLLRVAALTRGTGLENRVGLSLGQELLRQHPPHDVDFRFSVPAEYRHDDFDLDTFPLGVPFTRNHKLNGEKGPRFHLTIDKLLQALDVHAHVEVVVAIVELAELVTHRFPPFQSDR